MKPFLKQAFVVFGAALNIAGHGCAHGYPAVLFAQLKSNGGPVTLTDHDMSWIASVVGVMGLIGNFISPVLMSRFGRQKAHLITTLPGFLGWVIFVFGNSVSMFILARLLHGVALGLRTPLAAILVAEYTDPKYRGAFIGTFAISLGLGILLSHVWGASMTWKLTAATCALIPLISMVIISLSPESPSWLISKGRFDEAIKSFKWLRGEGEEQNKELSEMIEAQKESINYKQDAKSDKEKKISCNGITKSVLRGIKRSLKIFRKKVFYKPTIITICMLMVFEFGGAHMIPAYGNQILQAVLDKKNPEEVNGPFTIIDILRTICAFLAIFLLKCLKRRTILFTSGILTVLSLGAVSAFVFVREAGYIKEPRILDILPLALMYIYTVSFCLGLVPLAWVICGEVFPLAYRSLGSTISTSFLTPSFVISMKTAPHLYSSVGVQGAFLLYALILTVGLFIIYLLLPETKDRTLQDIENSFRGKQNRESDVEMKLIEE